MSALQEQVTQLFTERYGKAPAYLVRSPGRVNLIGEHTDYNDGFVLPMAIDRAAWIALRPRPDREVNVYSADFDYPITFDLDNFAKGKPSPAEYIKGVAWALVEAGHALNGWDGVLMSDVPIGSGLSSSAALELAVARAFATVSDLPWDAATMAKLGQRVENLWIGTNSGIMDQMIVAAGKTGYALLIDCRSLETEQIPVPPGTAVVVLDTGTRRGLVGSAYNERRQQCEAAAAHFGVKALRDVTGDEFNARSSELDDITRRRARHVITENARTLAARDAMQRGDAAEMGRLMDASHASLRDDFEVSTDALNAIVEAARAHPACYGARMTGAGFGGCGVALIEAAAADDFTAQVEAAYRQQTEHEPQLYVCHPTDGTAVVG